MELKAQYSLNDLIGLVKQDLENKGFNILSGMDTNLDKDFYLAVQVEPAQQIKEIKPALVTAPAPDPVPASTKVVVGRKVKGVSVVGRTEAQLEQQRVYRNRHLEKKKREIEEKAREAVLVEQAQAQQLAEIENQVRQAAEKKEAQEVVASASVPFHVTVPMLENLRN